MPFPWDTLPNWIVGATVLCYWACVVVMIVRVSRKTRHVGRVVVPAQRIEQLMWIVWTPLIVLWIATPFIAAQRSAWLGGWLAIWGADWYAAPAMRLLAAGAAVACLAASIVCWRHMGKHWRMGVDPEQCGTLFTDGPFAYVRHPIYALSILLMLATLVAVPNAVMLLLAIVHVTLMNLKARNEERHLHTVYGASYREYCRRTGRFLPGSRRGA
ncbi:MAG: isoprenylcysteine carboxylmethyltransferase family protein [Phycisphaerae bacterium]